MQSNAEWKIREKRREVKSLRAIDTPLKGKQTAQSVASGFQGGVWQPIVLDTPEGIMQAVDDNQRSIGGRPGLLDIYVVGDADRFFQRFGAVQVGGEHSITRRFLSLNTGIPAHAIIVVKGEHGKPMLMQRRPMFNLSHTDSWYAFAITNAGSIGVDVERLDRRISGSLAEWLLPVPNGGEYQVSEIFKERCEIVAWTTNEAFVKAIGCGLQNRNIGRFVSCYRQSVISPCGLYQFAWMEWRCWLFISILREPVVTTFAIRKDSWSAFHKEQIRFIWFDKATQQHV
jgi:hypothetical protein